MIRADRESVKLIDTLKTNFGPTLKAKLAGEYLQVFADNSDQYSKITRYLKENGHYAFITPAADQPIVAVMRGVPLIIEEKDVSDDLIRQGFTTSRVIRKIGRNRAPIPLVTLILQKTPQNAKIFDVDSRCGLIVSVEPARYNGRFNVTIVTNLAIRQ